MNARIVNSNTEWDPLEEIIVGRLDGAMIPTWDAIDHAAHATSEYSLWHRLQGTPHQREVVQAAQTELDNLVHILEAEGVTVRRPDPIPLDRKIVTLHFEHDGGFNLANPRDILMVIGNEIIESPSPRRGRYFESLAYRSLFKEYNRKGARWTCAPRSALDEASYVADYPSPEQHQSLIRAPGEPLQIPLTENEPLFEAADFVRCGKDIFYHRSFVTNQSGVDWLKQHVGPEYRFHEIDTLCRRPIHIDTTFLPLAPGKAIANPEFAPRLPEILKKWDVLYAPEPTIHPKGKSPFDYSSKWLNINVLSIDSERVLVDAQQERLMAKLRDWGFKPIPIPFQSHYAFGGGLHCATLDVRRRGSLQSYF